MEVCYNIGALVAVEVSIVHRSEYCTFTVSALERSVNREVSVISNIGALVAVEVNIVHLQFQRSVNRDVISNVGALVAVEVNIVHLQF